MSLELQLPSPSRRRGATGAARERSNKNWKIGGEMRGKGEGGEAENIKANSRRSERRPLKFFKIQWPSL